MNERWPSERRAEAREASAESSFKTALDFLNLLSLFSLVQTKAFDDVISWIVNQSGDLSELEQRTAQVADEFAQVVPDSNALLMTLACAAALAQMPTLRTWSKVNALKYDSWKLGHWLSAAMIAYSEVHPSACDSYTKLAKETFTALENFSLQSRSERANEERVGAWNNWNTRPDKIEKIWWGLRGWHGFMNYQEELPLFYVFYKLEPDEFIRTISRSANPYLVSALLFVVGIGASSPRFSEWKRMIVVAPVAFEADGKWNGSVLMPLLLVEARNQVLHVPLDLNPDLTPGELDEIKQEISSTAELIVNALAARQDASAIFVRWVPWLVRQLLSQTEKDLSDVKSSAYADNSLIDAIGRKLENRFLPQTVPDSAPLWEDWCYRCALASFAYDEQIQTPAWKSFGDEWNLSPEDWAGDKGRSLRKRANLISNMNEDIPGIAANLLAYPIAQSSSSTEDWTGLWNNTITLREIVEFGDADTVEDEYSSRSEAGRLLFLLFRIGLAIFDQGAAHSSDKNSPKARSLAGLFKTLNSACNEMREIDSTLNYDEWLLAAQHLVIRRIIWEDSSVGETASMSFNVFKSNDRPTISEILSEEKGNTIELVAILQSLLLNSSDMSRVKAGLHSASIDVSSVVLSHRRLNEYHPGKYPIDEAQLQKLEALV
ncbi:hypothetical protein E8Q33_03515 [Methylophaga sp. SB9B]|uniref:hypothetical protein n=1 Tax=Methylophaga sp. SB9B TaxID=2570356 RepID=UPI0010A7CC96|nr:hypothetical protein [Methylophaga sp. SB9B]THK42608.1 hypothetical protein E8Q33_03515 [Methylophaga sp. SB9B]